jgi:hypothetical protein
LFLISIHGGIFEEFIAQRGNKPKARLPRTNYVTKPPRDARAMRERFLEVIVLEQSGHDLNLRSGDCRGNFETKSPTMLGRALDV